MANWTTLKAAIADVIKTNGNQEITAAVLQNTLNSIVNAIGENATYAGIATPSTNPGAPDGPVFYFANVSGVYSNFNGIELKNPGLVVLYNASGTWKSIKLYECLQGLGTSVQFPISQQAITNLLSNLQIEFIKRLQGTSEDSDALHDPHKWLGSMTSEEEMNTLLDGLHTSGVEGIAKAGYFRGDITGTPFTVENIPVGYNTDTWLQSVRGYFKPADSGKRLTRLGEEYAVLWRKCAKGAWGVWERLGGGTTVLPYVAFDFGVLQKKIGGGRMQSDLDAFGLTEEVWAKIRGAEIMVIRDDLNERTYIVVGSSDNYISFSYGMNEDYEGWEIAYSGDTYTISRHQTQGGGGGESITIE